MDGKHPHNTARLDAAVGSQIGDAVWRKPTGSQFASPVVTTAETAFVCTQSTLVGVGKSGGRTALTQSLPGGVSGAPAVADDLVVVPRDTFGEGFDQIDLDTPTLYAVDRETGEQTWRHTLDGAYLGSVAVADDIYVQSDRETRRITTDGVSVWRHTFAQSFDWREIHSHFRPVIGPDVVYVAHRDRLVGLDRATGEIVWTRSTGETDFPPVVVDANTLVVSTGDAVVGLGPDDGRVRWRVDESPMWGPAVGDGHAVVSTEGALLGVDPASGEQRWRSEQAQSTCPPVVAGGLVFTAPGGTTLAVTDAATGDRLDSRDLGTSVDWITPDAAGLLTREATTDGPVIGRYPLR